MVELFRMQEHATRQISKGIKPAAIRTPGMHPWMVWRDNLSKFAPLLFQKGPAEWQKERPCCSRRPREKFLNVTLRR